MINLKTMLSSVVILGVSVVSAVAQDAVGLIDAVEGEVVIKRVGEFYNAQDMGSIQDGDCISSLEEATALIALMNSCSLNLEPGQSFTVNASAETCEKAFVPANELCAVPFASQSFQASVLPLIVGVSSTSTVSAAVLDANRAKKPTSP